MVLHECLRLFAILTLFGELAAEYFTIFVCVNVTMMVLCAPNSNDLVCVNLGLAVNLLLCLKRYEKYNSKLSKIFFVLNYNN